MKIKGSYNFKSSIFKSEDLIIRDEYPGKKEMIDWNSVMKLGVEIKNSWIKRKDIFDKYIGLADEMDFIGNEIFINLKGKILFFNSKIF